MKIKLPLFALAALLFVGLPVAKSSAYVAVSVGFAPPVIPIYEQPYAPGLGYIWTPGYWAYSDFGYYWVPGIWTRPPRIGLLWTPGYWHFSGGRYLFNDGYWATSVGFYGGINYGFGYTGSGYYGGRWNGDRFLYNTAVTRVNKTVINNNYTYVNKDIPQRNQGNRAAFNGPGGAQAKASARELAVAKGKHVPPTTAQRSRVEAAKKDPALHAANNKGKPDPEAVQRVRRQVGNGEAGNDNAAAPKANAKNQREPADANNKVKAARKAQSADDNTNARTDRAERAPRAEGTAKPSAQHRNTSREATRRPVDRSQSAAHNNVNRRAPHSAVPNRPHRPASATQPPAAARRAQTSQRRPAAHQRQAVPAQQQKAKKKKRAQEGQPDRR